MEFKVNVAFKEEYSKLVALFTHRYGYDKIELIEDAIQETFYKALKIWPNNPPKNSKGWLRTVTRNGIIDKLRQKQHAPIETMENQLIATEQTWDDAKQIRDNQLKMIFACCHPELKTSDQLLLSLKFLCGFGSGQIARALLKKGPAVEKAISRARVKFKSVASNLDIPGIDELGNRLDGVLKVIYLQFTEGYKVSEGSHLTNKSLCIDAIKLAELLTTYRQLTQTKIYALLALMYFQASRLEARVDHKGTLMTLSQQDRGRWNYKHILQGIIYLGKAGYGTELSSYHIEAAVASFHCTSPSYELTNWQAIIDWYDLGIQATSNRNYQLNRLIAYRQLHSAEETMRYMDPDSLPNNQFTYVFMGDLQKDLGHGAAANKLYQKALEHTTNKPEKDFIRGKIIKGS